MFPPFFKFSLVSQSVMPRKYLHKTGGRCLKLYLPELNQLTRVQLRRGGGFTFQVLITV